MVASLGATAFIVFAMPKSITAKPRNIVGGYLIGILAGTLITLVPDTLFGLPSILYSLAVGLSIFGMTITDTEHPPASGAALAVSAQGFSLEVVGIVLAGALTLALIHSRFNKYFKNLV